MPGLVKPGRWRRGLRATLFGVYSLLAGLVLTELFLRLVDYRFSPIALVRPDNADDHRPFHMGGFDFRIRGHPLTIADPVLLWRLDPAASPELTPEGFRSAPLPAPHGPIHLIVALGDSNTVGPLDTAAHWPGLLEDLLNANRSGSPFQVVNAGVYGYSSFQGLRRFRQVARYDPAIAYFSFGANDAQPVRRTDEQYAQRVDGAFRWRTLRCGPPLLHLAWRAAEALRPPRATTHRVPLDAYRRNLETFVEEARRAGIVPVLMTRPFLGSTQDPGSLLHHLGAYNEVTRGVALAKDVPLLDAFALLDGEPAVFVDPIHNDRIGYRRLAEAALTQLKALGVVQTDSGRRLEPVLDLATADDRRLELGPGFWSPEKWRDGGSGRWTQAEASVELQRRHREQRLRLDVSCFRPAGPTRGVIEVNARRVAELPATNGRHRMAIDLGPQVQDRINVRFLVDSAYRPRDLDPKSDDARVLGVFVHEVRLE